MLKATCVKEPKQRNKNKRVYLYLAQPTELIEEISIESFSFDNISKT